MKKTTAVMLAVCYLGMGLVVLIVPQEALAANPQLTLYKVADKYTVTPGDLVIYSVYFDNIDNTKVSRIVWINDTLPAGITYLNDTAYTIYQLTQGLFVYKNLSGGVLRLKFIEIAPGNHSFIITARVDNTLRDGDFLTNVAEMNYTSNSGLFQPPVVASNTTKVSMPVMHLSKSATVNPADPTVVVFSLTVSNTGSAEALHLWLNDSFPPGVSYVSFQAPPAVSCAGLFPGAANCTRDHFPPGANEIWNLTGTISASVPADTLVTNHAYLDSASQRGVSLLQIQASASFVSGTALITVEKQVDQAGAKPGTNNHYTILYNNTGTVGARDVWINDTLPIGVTVVSASIPPVYNASGQVRWYLTGVGVGAHALTMEGAIASNVANGTLLNNYVTLDYIDALGRKKLRSEDNAVTEVRYDIPTIHIMKIASSRTVRPGGEVTYTMYFNNTGLANAKTVTIEDVIPIGTQITASAPGYNSVLGNHYTWNLHDIAPGGHSISVTLLVDIAVQNGTELWNTATVTYTDAYGQPVESNFQRVLVTASTVTEPPDNGNNKGEQGIPVVVVVAGIVVTIVIIALIFFFARRRGEAFLDDVFLLHKDGLLIKHFTRKLNPEVDSDILGGMLIAVQNFVNESFASNRGLAKEGGLDELKFGRYSVLLARGRYVVLAAVATGRNTQGASGEIRATITDLEKKLGAVLENWGGDMSQVEEADKYIQDLMAGKYKGKGRSQPKPSPKPATDPTGKMS